MKKPGDEDKRDRLYVLINDNYFAGEYVGETPTHVVLRTKAGVQGILWKDVEPVTMREAK